MWPELSWYSSLGGIRKLQRVAFGFETLLRRDSNLDLYDYQSQYNKRRRSLPALQKKIGRASRSNCYTKLQRRGVQRCGTSADSYMPGSLSIRGARRLAGNSATENLSSGIYFPRTYSSRAPHLNALIDSKPQYYQHHTLKMDPKEFAI